MAQLQSTSITGSLIVTGGITGSLLGTSSFALTASYYGGSIVSASYAATASYVQTAQTASYVLNTVSASFASTASRVNTLNQSVLITGSLTVGATSAGASENTITLGARDASNEGGQIGFNAPGGTYTSASFIDNWQNYIRILRGNNTTSDALVTQWNLHTKQMQLPAYTNASSFVGTATANLAVDSGGNVITVSTSGGTVFPYTGNAVITGSLTTTGIIYAQPNGGMYFQGGDDAALYDINLSNHIGIYGVQDSTIGSIKLGSGGGIISGKSGNIGIGTTNPTSASFQVNGNVWANSFTGSLSGNVAGTASWASNVVGGIGVTSVGTSGTVSGITLTGGTITSTGTITLGGSISGLTNSNLSGTAGITNANLANSTITIAGTSVSLGGSIAQSTILAGSGVFSGSAQITGLTNSNLSGTAGITNANLANSSVTIGSTAISLGGTSTTLAGLTSVTATNFTGTASYATQALSSSYALTAGSTAAIAGTTNYVSKFTSGTAIGNSQIFDNGTSVGIGTNTVYANNRVSIEGGISGSPSWNNATLELRSTGSGTVNLSLHRAGYTHANIYSDDGSISFSTSGVERVKFQDVTGYVGIGTTSPNRLTEISSNGGGVLGIVNSSAGSGILYGRLAMYSTAGANAYIDYGGEIRSYSGPGIDYSDLRFYTAAGSTSTEKIRITAEGNVGIGVTNPGKKLVVAGNGNGTALIGDAGFTDYTGISLNGTLNSTYYNILSSPYDNSLFINRPTGCDIRFRENNSDQVTILTGGNVGIGTTSPGYKLDVAGTISSNYGSNQGTLWLGGIAQQNATFTSYGILDFTMHNGGGFTDIMRIQGNGNVGIGTTSPSYKLDAVGEGRFGTGAKAIIGTDGTYAGYGVIGFGGTTDGFNRIFGHSSTSDGLYIASATGRGIEFWVNGSNTTAMRINPAGNVGIGTTSPSKKLHVKGGNDNVLFLDNGGEQYTSQYFANNGTTKSFLVWDNTNSIFEVGTAVSADLRFVTNNLERLRITSTGNVGIGTTTPNGKLDVNGNTIITGSLDVSGSFIIYDESNVKAIQANTSKRALFDTSTVTSVNWGGRGLYTPTSILAVDWSENDYLSSDVYQRDYKSRVTQNSVSNNLNNPYASYLGDLIEVDGGDVIFDGTVNDGMLVYLDTNATWYPVSQGSTTATKMIGIACNVAGPSGYVLLEGHVVITDTGTSGPHVTGADHGLPIYIEDSTTTGQMSTVVPTTTSGTNVIRVLGHCYWNNAGTTTQWMMKFRPSNDWIVI